jgi:hypothetical protein
VLSKVSIRGGQPPRVRRCRSSQEGIANLANNRDYNQLVLHVNANRSPSVALTLFQNHSSSARPLFLTRINIFALLYIIRQITLLLQVLNGHLSTACLTILIGLLLPAFLLFFAFLPSRPGRA